MHMYMRLAEPVERRFVVCRWSLFADVPAEHLSARPWPFWLQEQPRLGRGRSHGGLGALRWDARGAGRGRHREAPRGP
eukprot:2606914-Lingulodinium_polyedra.AAC.1